MKDFPPLNFELLNLEPLKQLDYWTGIRRWWRHPDWDRAALV